MLEFSDEFWGTEKILHKKVPEYSSELFWDVRIKLGLKSEILIYLNKLLPRGGWKLRIAASLKLLSFATH